MNAASQGSGVANFGRPAHRQLAHLQAGMGTTAVLAIMGVAIFVGMFAFKIGPSYFENMTINKIVSDKVADRELMSGPKGKLMSSLNRAYDQNNLWEMKAEDTIELKKDKANGFIVTVKYEKRANLFGNIDVVTFFEKEVTPGT